MHHLQYYDDDDGKAIHIPSDRYPITITTFHQLN